MKVFRKLLRKLLRKAIRKPDQESRSDSQIRKEKKGSSQERELPVYTLYGKVLLIMNIDVYTGLVAMNVLR
jgi:hypothetical protein